MQIAETSRKRTAIGAGSVPISASVWRLWSFFPVHVAQTSRKRTAIGAGSMLNSTSMETIGLLSSANGTNDGEEEMEFEPTSNTINH